MGSVLPAGNKLLAGTIIQPIDWISSSKTIVIEVAALGTLATILTGHGSPDIVSLAWALFGTLGVLRISDTIANVAAVRGYMAKSNGTILGGMAPLPTGTSLIKTEAGQGGGSDHAG